MQGASVDRWMERWLLAMRNASSGTPVLELGCDTGGDTAWLVANGFDVIGTDISESALRQCAAAAPQAQLLVHDLREPMPFAGASFGVVIASLCLHYFDWKTTVAAVEEIRRVLRPGGLFLCRLNSTNDVQHGAMQGTEIEHHYFRQEAHYADCKRFFDGDDLDRLFTPHWKEESRAELSANRYAKPKVAWELVFRPA